MPVSCWIDSTPGTDYPPLTGTVEVDVAVLGAGIAGITAATLLKREGRTVALVEAKRIVRGVTGYTTAKLTSGHGLIYASLAKHFGEQGARTYAESNQAGIERVAQFVEELRIECDFERLPNYVYTDDPAEVAKIEDEVDAAEKAGLPVSFVTETDLPFKVAGAIRLENQAQFHPRKYLLALAQGLAGDGSHLFESTRALAVAEGSPCRVDTAGGVVLARDVILTTHIPFLDRGLFFAKAHPHRSYALSAPIEDERAPRGMYINTSPPTRSIRTVPAEGGRLLLVGGEGHKPGEEPDTEQRYRNLETFLRDGFGVTAPVTHRWSTQDYLSVDQVPYVGRLTRRSRQVLVATGFGKWGMSNGTLAGMILADEIVRRPNAWASLYDAKRLKPLASASKFAKENASVAKHFVRDRLKAGSLAELQPGEGGIVDTAAGKVAAYRDDENAIHALSPVCTHLRCYVQWNGAEKSWDCPCHGSRFTTEGTVIQGPATKDLRQVEVTEPESGLS